jgi:nucleotide sugar dehydrogenase
MQNFKIGFIGQGWIGKNYADNFEERGFEVVRYDKTDNYIKNKEAVKKCEIVFVAVPTPTTPKGFDCSILVDAISDATVPGQIVVIKSTVKIGTTEMLQQKFSDRFFIHSPEFLTESTARHDVDFPERNIVGITDKSEKFAERVLEIFPSANHDFIVSCRESELVKYMGNCYFYAKNMMSNIFYDLANQYDIDHETCRQMVACDSRIGEVHTHVFHKGGRGAGGDCLIKDMAALREMIGESLSDADKEDRIRLELMEKALSSLENLNRRLLKETKKSEELLKMVYGE